MSHIVLLIVILIATVVAAGTLFFSIRNKRADSPGRPRPTTESFYAPAGGGFGVRRRQEKDPELAAQVIEIPCTGYEVPDPIRLVNDVDKVLMDLMKESYEIPSAVVELSTLLRDPETGVKKVTAYAATDPVLSARILQVANSPAFGSSTIKSLSHAIAFLGFNQVWLLATQIMTARSFRNIMSIDPKELNVMWIHSALTATCAQRLLLDFGLIAHPMGSMVMTAALFHDMGKFFLTGLSPSEQDANDGAKPPLVRELAEYGTDHCRVGLLLTTFWKLPEEICTLVAYHHHGAFGNWTDIPASLRRFAMIITLSDHLAHLWTSGGNASQEAECVYAMPETIFSTLDLRPPARDLLTRELKHDLVATERIIREAGGHV